MPVIPTRFPVEFGAVFPCGVFILGVEPTLEFSDDRTAPRRQEQDKETNQLVWTVRVLDANEDAGLPVRPGGVRGLNDHSLRQRQGPGDLQLPDDRDAGTYRRQRWQDGASER